MFPVSWLLHLREPGHQQSPGHPTVVGRGWGSGAVWVEEQRAKDTVLRTCVAFLETSMLSAAVEAWGHVRAFFEYGVK